MCTLISKYNVPGPRYTSYPTVPYWDNDLFYLKSWKETLQKSFEESNTASGISLYIHLPFCESLCTFCGCTKRITKNHAVEVPYIKALLKELYMYQELFDQKIVVKQIHLGGGTPTFFSAKHLDRLMCGIFSITKKSENCELSFEGHPNNTTREHLEALAGHGFKRVCYGVQDYNEFVQQAINRVQPYQNVLSATSMARECGYHSVGHDIIYGLPFQTKVDVINTIKKTISLGPDTIAFYSYAHVPWMKGNGQRGFKDKDLPCPEEKRLQYEIGKQLLLEAGYAEIGMDHFALKNDPLYRSQKLGTIHRNFMGYTANKTQLMLGLGVSAIGDSWYGFAQNVKSLEEYHNLIEHNVLPIFRGHLLTREDLAIRKHILNLMCTFHTSWETPETYLLEIPQILSKMVELENDGLVAIASKGLTITEKGKPFVRNICMAFDLRLERRRPNSSVFSMTI